MRIFFSTLFDKESYPVNIFLRDRISLGDIHLGPLGLLNFFELHLGLGYYNDVSNLRVLQYGEQLRAKKEGCFYEKSFDKNELDVARTLLEWRDELVMAGWDFQVDESTPDRLQALAKVEEGLELEPGVADRYTNLLDAVAGYDTFPVTEIWLHEPLGLMPPFFQRLFTLLESKMVTLQQRVPCSPINGATNLDRLKSFVLQAPGAGGIQRSKVVADDTIRILRFPTMLAASKALSSFMEANPSFRPVVVNESEDSCLSLALKHDGLAATGQAKACSVDPDVQLLSLLPVWLWKPYEPQQLLDFLLAPNNILPETLCKIWAESFCKNPGVKNDHWNEKINQYLDKVDEAGREKYRARLDFLFSVATEQNSRIGREELVRYFNYFYEIFNRRKFFAQEDESRARTARLCGALKELIGLIGASRKEEFSKLELEKLIYMVLKPYSVVVHPKEAEGLHEVSHPGLLVDGCGDLLWFDFYGESSRLSRNTAWMREEIDWLEGREAAVDLSESISKRYYWFLTQWLHHVSGRLFLIVPSVVEGESAQPHPFLALLKACFTDIHSLVKDIEQPEQMVLDGFRPLCLEKKPVAKIPAAPAYWKIHKRDLIPERDNESYNSLNKLVGYPYQWVMEYGAKLKRGHHFCLPALHAFYGNLSHAIFQCLLLMEDILSLSERELQSRYEETAREAIETDGSLLFMKGEEKKLRQFSRGLFRSFRTLVHHIKDNGWQVEGCEREEPKDIGGEHVKGKCDVLLRKPESAGERAIIDLKYAGLKKYRDLMYEEKDLQLAIYSKVFHHGDGFCPTAYFIIESELMFCTDRKAFRNAIEVPPGGRFPASYIHMLEQLEKVVNWRRNELSKGDVEVGEDVAISELSIYQSDLTELLPVPKGKKKPKSDYNNYSTFIDTE